MILIDSSFLFPIRGNLSMKKTVKFCFLSLILLAATLASTVFASTNIYIKIMDPTDHSNSALGNAYGGYWVGEIPIKVGGSSPPTEATVAFCMNYDKGLKIGTTYQASLSPVVDNPQWRAISYLLTWNFPTTDNEASMDQVAIWHLLTGGFSRPSWLSTTVFNSGVSLAGQVNGKDVVREGDTLEWVTSSNVKASSGEAVTFQAKLATGSIGRENVKILFSATITSEGSSVPLSSTYVSPTEAFTDDQGLVQVTVTVPSETLHGSSIEVKASTKGTWVNQYININDLGIQDLIGMGTSFQLTTSKNIYILANIMVVPEYSVGALGAVAACFAALLVIKRRKLKSEKQ
jgi:hypothetical protein